MRSIVGSVVTLIMAIMATTSLGEMETAVELADARQLGKGYYYSYSTKSGKKSSSSRGKKGSSYGSKSSKKGSSSKSSKKGSSKSGKKSSPLPPGPPTPPLFPFPGVWPIIFLPLPVPIPGDFPPGFPGGFPPDFPGGFPPDFPCEGPLCFDPIGPGGGVGKKNGGGGGGAGKKAGGGKKGSPSPSPSHSIMPYRYLQHDTDHSLEFVCGEMDGDAYYSGELVQLVAFEMTLCVEDASDPDGMAHTLQLIWETEILYQLAFISLDCHFNEEYECSALVYEKTALGQLVNGVVANDGSTCFQWTGLQLSVHYFKRVVATSDRLRQLEGNDEGLNEVLTSTVTQIVSGLDTTRIPNVAGVYLNSVGQTPGEEEDDEQDDETTTDQDETAEASPRGTVSGLAGNEAPTSTNKGGVNGFGIFFVIFASVALMAVGAAIFLRRKKRQRMELEAYHDQEDLDSVDVREAQDYNVMPPTPKSVPEMRSVQEIPEPETPQGPNACCGVTSSLPEPETPETGRMCCDAPGLFGSGGTKQEKQQQKKTPEPGTPDAGGLCCDHNGFFG